MRPERRGRARARRAGRALRALLAAGLLVALLPASGGAGEEWGWLGVRIRDLTEQEMEELSAKLGVREGYGVLIAEVITETPAQAAGLRDGDLIVAIDGRPVTETRILQRVIGNTPAGREITLSVLRDRRRQDVRAHVGQMPPEMVAERIALEFGFFVRDVPPDNPAAPASRAPVVAAVTEGSSAARAGLMVGDRIRALNARAIDSMEAFRHLAREVLLRDPLELRVERRGEQLTLSLPPAQPPRL
jgi:serine protease Do